MCYVYEDYAKELCDRLKKYGICMYDTNSKFVGFQTISNELNNVYRKISINDTDENKDILNLLHSVNQYLDCSILTLNQ